jgi:quinoprotein glucose dehydrogenase
MDEPTGNAGRPRYRWPYFVLAGLVLGVVLAVLWMSVLVRRLREQRDPDAYPAPNRTEPATGTSTNRTNVSATNSDPLSEFRFALQGGNAAAGRKIFFERPEANCGKCHKAGGQGGEVGPVLDGIGARQTREFILESIVFPNAQTTTNFETVIVIMKNGSGHSGTLRSENATDLTLINAEDGLITVRKSDIQSRLRGLSPMPEGLGRQLAPQDLRDLVEFVAGLK